MKIVQSLSHWYPVLLLLLGIHDIYTSSYSLAQNSYFGIKGPHDRLLYITRARRDSRVAKNVSMEVHMPPPDQQIAGLITYIEALDMDKDGTGGYARLKEGGIGQYEVTLGLVSQRGKPIDFIVRIYGNAL
uniref:Uncharacterized protein n=1 Tax=Riptortus pedestris TaxID=329032 RepID=R4WCZ5_RIPPE|nr:unknown secreted protein [Riptortus pedestris]